MEKMFTKKKKSSRKKSLWIKNIRKKDHRKNLNININTFFNKLILY